MRLVIVMLTAVVAALTTAAVLTPAAQAGKAYYSINNGSTIYGVECAAGNPTPTRTTVATGLSGSRSGVTSDGTYIYYATETSGSGAVIRRAIADGSETQIAGLPGLDQAKLRMPAGGTDLYIQNQNTLFKITGAASVAASTARPVQNTIASSPFSYTPAFAVHPTNGTIYYQSDRPTVSGAPTVYTAPAPTFGSGSTGGITVTAIPGAPTRGGGVTAIAQIASDVYVPYDAQWDATTMQKWNGTSWDAAFAALPMDPRQDGSSGFNNSTSYVLPADFFSTYDGNRHTLWMIGTGRGSNRDYSGYLFAYDTYGWALMAELGNAGGTGDYLQAGSGADPSCQFDSTKMMPTLKSWEDGDKPTTLPTSWTAGTRIRVNFDGTWTRSSSSAPDPVTYEWQLGDSSTCSQATFTAITGETNSTYTPAEGDANLCLRVKITVTSVAGIAGKPVYIAQTVMRASSGGGGGGGSPSYTQPVTRGALSGTAAVGCTVSVGSAPVFSSPAQGSPTLRWWRWDSDPNGATPPSGPPTSITAASGTSYTLTDADAGKWIQVAYSVGLQSGATGTDSFGVGPVAASGSCSSDAGGASETAVGPALKISTIPAEIALTVGASSGGIAREITASVPCTAPEGELLDRCTVNVTAPQYVLLGQGDGISVRASKTVSIGRATVRAATGRKTIIVKVKINQRGRKALKRNLKIRATVGLSAVTLSNLASTGDKKTTMRLPTQLISPQAGIFASGSTTLNRAGVAFVNRLAKLLPDAPKRMVFIGFTDITGVPGDNRWIADRRAKAVRDALEAKGVEAARTSIEVKAARSPRDDNATDKGRERNRRVSIRITY